jgi:hypothetical protein
MLGAAFLALGVFLSAGAVQLLALILAAAVGSLLFFSGVELEHAAKPQHFIGSELFVVLTIAAVGFLLGLAVAIVIRRGWVHV